MSENVMNSGSDISAKDVIISDLKLMGISWVYMLVVVPLNAIGVFIMMFIANCGLPKVVNRTILSLITIPVTSVILILFPLIIYVEPVRNISDKVVSKLSGYFFEF